MIKRFLLLLAIVFTISSTISCPCCDAGPGEWIEIINNSEHDITWEVLMQHGYVLQSKRERIAKNGGLFYFTTNALGSNFIVCVEAEDTPELMCVDEFKVDKEQTKTLIWNGKDDPAWKLRQ